MPHTAKLIAIFIVLVSFNAWAEIKSPKQVGAEAKSEVTHLSVEQLAGYLANDEAFTLIDVRTEAEFEAGHIQGAKWMPRGKLEFAIQELITEPDSKIVLYCGSGARSALATLALQGIGYENAVDLDGGFKQWVADGHSVYNMHGELKVVAYKKEE
jgi:rhodanese-related sulfurtransferase